MKAKVNVYQPPPEDGKAYPQSLLNLRQYYLMHFTTLMRIYGIAQIGMTPAQAGLRVVPKIGFRPMTTGPDDPSMLTIRPDVVRRIAEDMMIVGVMELELTPDAADAEPMQMLWTKIKTTDNPLAGPQNKPGDIPLNIEEDPTAKSVISDDADDAEKPDNPGEPTPSDTDASV